MDIKEKVDFLCTKIENELYIYRDYPSVVIIETTSELINLLQSISEEWKKQIELQLLEMLERDQVTKYAKVWMYSAIVSINNNVYILEKLLDYIITEDGLGANIKYFLLYQIVVISFQNADMNNDTVKYLKWKLLEQVVELFKAELSDLLLPIAYDERDKNVAIVLIDQFLTPRHAPTRRCLEKCKILLQTMNKKVLIINTAEAGSFVGVIPFYHTFNTNYLDSYLVEEKIEWEGVSIPFCQCERNMPNIFDLRILLQTVRNLKPGLVITIGGMSILANLVQSMVSVLTVGLSASNMEITMTSCQTLSRELEESDLNLLERMGIQESSIIRSVANFIIPKQTVTLTRRDIGLPEDKFVIFVVGNRLDLEIDQAFIDMLVRAMDEDIVIAFIGIFNIEIVEKVPELQNRIFYYERCRELFEFLEVCDLYVNPYRNGGGTSGVWALIQGKPVVTTPYGDVAANVGEEFWTESYETMSVLIKRYKNDADFYRIMSEKAKARAKILTDAENEFVHVIEEFEKRTNEK